MTDLERLAEAADGPPPRHVERRQSSAGRRLLVLLLIGAVLAIGAVWLRNHSSDEARDNLISAFAPIASLIVIAAVLFWIIYAAVRAAMRDRGK